MTNFELLPDSDLAEPEYEDLYPNNIDKVLRVKLSPARREIVDNNDVLLDISDASKARGLFKDDETYRIFYKRYQQSKYVNSEFDDLLLENYHQPDDLQRDITLYNELIERSRNRLMNNPEDMDEVALQTSLKALEQVLYGGSVNKLQQRAKYLTDLIETSQLAYWVVGRKNHANKDAIAAPLVGAGLVKFGKGKALRALVSDKNGEIGTLPEKYVVEPLLYTPIVSPAEG